MDVKTKKAPMVAALLAVLWAFGAPAAAEASLPLDARASRVFKTADPFATAPQLDLPSLTEQLRAVEERRATASGCVALCELAAGIEAHPFGAASAEPLNRSEDAWGSYRFTSELAPSKNRFGFTGHYWDNEAGLYYAKARFYDPFTARFTQADSFLGNINDPPSLHRYFYANDNPTLYVDPTGHETEYTMLNKMEAQIKKDDQARAWCSANATLCSAKQKEEAHSSKVAESASGHLLGAGTKGAAIYALLAVPDPSLLSKALAAFLMLGASDEATTGLKEILANEPSKSARQVVTEQTAAAFSPYDVERRAGVALAIADLFTLSVAGPGGLPDTAFESGIVPVRSGPWRAPSLPAPGLGEASSPRIGSTYSERLQQTPVENGWWSGQRGESIFHSYDAETNVLLRGGSVRYRDARPDFGPATLEEVSISGMSVDRRLNFKLADKALSEKLGIPVRDLKRWRIENKYTWHEVEDLKTMQLVPSRINNPVFPHLGGVGEIKKGAKP